MNIVAAASLGAEAYGAGSSFANGEVGEGIAGAIFLACGLLSLSAQTGADTSPGSEMAETAEDFDALMNTPLGEISPFEPIADEEVRAALRGMVAESEGGKSYASDQWEPVPRAMTLGQYEVGILGTPTSDGGWELVRQPPHPLNPAHSTSMTITPGATFSAHHHPNMNGQFSPYPSGADLDVVFRTRLMMYVTHQTGVYRVNTNLKVEYLGTLNSVLGK